MSSKSKFFLLIGGGLVVLLISYFMAISNTLAVRTNYLKLKEDTVSDTHIAKQFQTLSRKEVYYDSLLQQMNLSDTSLENNLLKTLNEEVGETGVKLKSFNTPHEYSDGTSTYTTIEFELEGSFVTILKVLHHLENTAAFGQVLHLDFYKETNYRTRRTSLNAKVLLQYIQ